MTSLDVGEVRLFVAFAEPTDYFLKSAGLRRLDSAVRQIKAQIAFGRAMSEIKIARDENHGCSCSNRVEPRAIALIRFQKYSAATTNEAS